MTHEIFLHAVSNHFFAKCLISGLRNVVRSPDYQFITKQGLTHYEVWVRANFLIPEHIIDVLRGKGKLR